MQDGSVLPLMELQDGSDIQDQSDEHAYRDDLVSDIFPLNKLDQDNVDLFGNTQTSYQDGFQTLLIEFSDLIHKSPSALYLLDRASYHGYELGFANLGNEGYEIDDENDVLYLDIYALKTDALLKSEHYRDCIFLNLMRGLRDVHHDMNMGDIGQLYCVDDLLKIERARLADIQSIAAQIAWELRASGEDHIWRNLIGQEDGDIAIAFWQALEERPSAIYDGRAMARGFKQWYTDQSRSDSCDRDMLDYLDTILRETADFNPFGKEHIPANIFESLFTNPQGRRYLIGWGETILKDPYYAGMHDEYNQAHLFQLMQDINVTVVEDVPFGDVDLARRIFPQEDSLL